MLTNENESRPASRNMVETDVLRLRLTSMLFVPGDRPERMVKALGFDADALILDLEDSVAANAKSSAREKVAAFLDRPRDGTLIFVRINALDSGLAEQDVAAVLPHRPDGIMLPKAEGTPSLDALDALLGSSPCHIFPIAAETPRAIFRLGDYATSSRRLCALTWGAEDLPAAIGATAREDDGRYAAPMELARSLTLFAAHAAQVAAIETVYSNFRDLEGLRRYAERAARDGFTGMLAIHPAQIPVINAAFIPSRNAVALAARIVDAFAAAPNAGVLSIDGQMVDIPHLKQARRILARGASHAGVSAA